MAQALPVTLPQEPPVQPATSTPKVDATRKGKAVTPESVAILSLFFG